MTDESPGSHGNHERLAMLMEDKLIVKMITYIIQRLNMAIHTRHCLQIIEIIVMKICCTRLPLLALTVAIFSH